MKYTVRKTRLFVLSSLMILIILDSHTAYLSVTSSIDLCIHSVIPSIFPFIFLGSAIASELRFSKFTVLENILHIPKYAAGYFLIGLICGYPVGAKLLSNAVEDGKIDSSTAERMMCFCNNASPAFIIGILSSIFNSRLAAPSMWIIQIFTSAFIGFILPKCESTPATVINRRRQNIGATLSDVLKTMATICGWVISFGVLLSYAHKFKLLQNNPILNALVGGALELTNGIFALQKIQNQTIQFILSSIFLSFGGICVIMQTISVAPRFQAKKYIIARLLHATISAALSSIAAVFLFPNDSIAMRSAPLFLCVAIISCMIFVFNKKMVAIRASI